jgi:heterodisulfide reductase subunit A-like polyferredoxin
MTSRPGVFAVGDAVTRDKMVVIEAIGMGNKAAAAIDAYLQGHEPHQTVVDARDVPISRREMTEDERISKPQIPVSTISLEQRRSSFLEVELGYSAEQAIAEAQRCLVCGPCSECMACVQVCKPGAVVHQQSESFTDLDIGAIIYADDPSCFDSLPQLKKQHFDRVHPEDPLSGSAAAARAMLNLYPGRQSTPGKSESALVDGPTRVGVVICQCGGEISQVVDTQKICDRATTWPNVVHTQVVPFACSHETADAIGNLVNNLDLSRMVLAGCSCCSLDQVCYSCTYQRIRCKENLGLFTSPGTSSRFEFVNIREQCAWNHRGDPQMATAKAASLVAAAVARARTVAARTGKSQLIERSVLILGDGAAAYTCQVILSGQGIAVYLVENIPDRIQRTRGQFVVTQGNEVFRSSSLVLAPLSSIEQAHLLSAFDRNGNQPQSAQVELDPLRPGIYYCDPGLDPEISGAAAAARVAAWLGSTASRKAQTAALVDSIRCRACGTCVEICEFGAPELLGDGPNRTAWIDPAVCAGCGTCAAHCPSGAIAAGYPSETQLEATLNVILAKRW